MRAMAKMAVLFLLSAPVVVASAAAGCGDSGTGTTTAVGGKGGGANSSSSSSGKGGAAGGTTSSSSSSSSSTSGDSGSCVNLGSACASATECCSGTCVLGVCNMPACTADNAACTSGASCCSGQCDNGTCTPLNTLCKTLNNPCGGNAECCSGLCNGGICRVSSFCTQPGDACTNGAECCGGVCNKPDGGGAIGTCAPPPTGSANCTLTDGMLCEGTLPVDGGIPACGGACCSRLCAPYGPTGTLVCQPASGCHVVGDLCKKDGDCCGSAGLPGGSGQPVTCDIAPGAVVGVCRNPQGCKPDGNVCKLATMSCNASCDCCSGNCNNEDTCHLDSVGVPRCSGVTCVPAGGSCASSANCCNGLPCVPNPSGTPPYICANTQCEAACGTCTINADCCPGTSCVVPTGSTSGICGPCTPPPDGGVPDAGPGPDGGPPPDAGPGPDAGPDAGDAGTVCSLYGQLCTTSADCCGGVPCNGANAACQPGQTNCACHYLIQ